MVTVKTLVTLVPIEEGWKAPQLTIDAPELVTSTPKVSIMAIPAIKRRLIQQLRTNGHSEASAHAIAQSSLRKSGNVDSSGKATAKGKVRGAMTPAERAKDRAAKSRGGKPSDYVYKKANNSALKIGSPHLRRKVKRRA